MLIRRMIDIKTFMKHIYCGDGKGKTTAAVGLAVRAAGAGKHVLFTQFFKSGNSSEIVVLSAVPNITVLMPQEYQGRYKNMDDKQRKAINETYHAFLHAFIEKTKDYDLIVLDEAVSAYGYGLFDEEALLTFLRTEGKAREIVLTGREPLPELLALADYTTEMRKEKHPFDQGVKARKGIEF